MRHQRAQRRGSDPSGSDAASVRAILPGSAAGRTARDQQGALGERAEGGAVLRRGIGPVRGPRDRRLVRWIRGRVVVFGDRDDVPPAPSSEDAAGGWIAPNAAALSAEI